MKRIRPNRKSEYDKQIDNWYYSLRSHGNQMLGDIQDLLDDDMPELRFMELADGWAEYFKWHPEVFEYEPKKQIPIKFSPILPSKKPEECDIDKDFVPRDSTIGEIWQYDYEGNKIRRLN